MVESGTRNTALTLSREHGASTSSGYAMLLVMLASLALGIFGVTLLKHQADLGGPIVAVASIVFVTNQPCHVTGVTPKPNMCGTNQ